MKKVTKKNFPLNWQLKTPPPRSYRSIFKWGDKNIFNNPNTRLLNYLINFFQTTAEELKKQQNFGTEEVALINPVKLPAHQRKALEKIVGREHVKSDNYTRLKYAYGKTMLDLLRLRSARQENLPDLVVFPGSKADIRKIVRYCNLQKIAIVAFGGGTSVTGAIEPVKGGITLDMKSRMGSVLDFNEKNQTITVEPGITGPDLEKILNNSIENFKTKRNFTCGHFPQSFEFSTVGGWIMASGSGQQSSYYGNARDLVVSQEYITPTGAFKTKDFPAEAAGPRINDIMAGSEGCFGILVGVTLKIFRYMPENRKKFSYIFKDWQRATEAVREVSQGEFGMPGLFRLSDPVETGMIMNVYGFEKGLPGRILKIMGYRPGCRCLLIGQTEGERIFSKVVNRKIRKIMKKHGGLYATSLPVLQWEKGRFKDPYIRDDLLDYGIIVDTLECSIKWDNVHRVYDKMQKFFKKNPGVLFLTHMSHFYPQGTNFYFIFFTLIKNVKKIDEYLKLQSTILDMIISSGAAISHHHGIGKLIAPWMEPYLGKQQLDILRALKRHFDPNNILNPGGTLGLDLPRKKQRKV